MQPGVNAAMSIVVDVSLISGKTVSVETRLDELVGSLRRRAQKALAVFKNIRLLDSTRLLDAKQTVLEAKLQTGTVLTLQVGEVKLCGTTESRLYGAFSAILGDGSVATWRSKHYGGDSPAVQDKLKDVQHIQASEEAFAAILSDGSAMTWGDQDFAGDGQLEGVQQIQASVGAFAAIMSDGSVVTCSGRHCGGDSRAVKDWLKGVQQIQASAAGFCSYPVRWISCYWPWW